MGIYAPMIKGEDIKKGLLIIDEKLGNYPPVSNKGPGIISFCDKASGKYKIFFFEQGIETGLLDLSKGYSYARIITEKEVIDFFERNLFSQRKLVKDKTEELFLETRKLTIFENASQDIPMLIKKYQA